MRGKISDNSCTSARRILDGLHARRQRAREFKRNLLVRRGALAIQMRSSTQSRGPHSRQLDFLLFFRTALYIDGTYAICPFTR